MQDRMFSDEQIEKAFDNLRKQEPDAYDFQDAIMRRITALELNQLQLEGILAVMMHKMGQRK